MGQVDFAATECTVLITTCKKYCSHINYQAAFFATEREEELLLGLSVQMH